MWPSQPKSFAVKGENGRGSFVGLLALGGLLGCLAVTSAPQLVLAIYFARVFWRASLAYVGS